MLSKAKIKYIRSLEQKKNRQQERVFVAEGPKVVGDLLKVASARLIVHTAAWKDCGSTCTERIEVTEEELRKISFLQHPQEVLAIFPIFDKTTSSIPNTGLAIALDGIQDPGNLGTIIRIADWFGISQIYCSKDTVDVYSPKVIQATMGSIARVQVSYMDLERLIDSCPDGYPVYGTLLDGNNIYEEPLSGKGLIVMGNEGNGISSVIRKRINHRLLIPNYPEGRKTADSLNVAIATAIVCNEFRRRKQA